MIAKYLRITIHDNDFTSSLKLVGELLYKTLCDEGNYPTEEQFPALKKLINHLWFGANMAEHLMRCGREFDMDYFDDLEPHLEFVNYADIPDDDNFESIYIPMFKWGEVLVR